ncbi:MAG: hypothetical protein ABI640_03460 [Gammaproteobacteria bacterium]
MPVSNPFIHSATRLSAYHSPQAFDRARRSPDSPLFGCAIGLLLLAPFTASALELGEASIKSGLGESLLVEIPYRLAGTEQLVSACVGLAPERTANELPTYSSVTRISVTPTHIQIFDERRVLEPLIGLNVEVHCADAPHFVRSYQLFVDPPTRIPTILSNGPAVAAAQTQPAIDATRLVVAPLAATPAVATETATHTATPRRLANAPVATTERSNVSPRARGLEGGDLPQGQTYRVVRGDTLSGIAARIAGRPVTINEAADAIFAANPAAFARGNPDLIEEGRSLTIPNLLPSSAALAAPSAPALPAVGEAERPAAPPVAAVDSAPEPSTAAQPLKADAASRSVSQDASLPLPAPAAVVATPRAAPVAVPTSSNVAPAAPSPVVTGRLSWWFIAALVVAALILLWAPLAFVRRRREQQAAAESNSQVREPLRRRPVELASRMGVVEGSMTGTHAAKQAIAMSGAEPTPVVDSAAALPAHLEALARSISSTDPVDFNIGAPTRERVEEVDDRGPIIDARDDTFEEGAPTALMPDMANEPTVRQPTSSSKAKRTEQPIDDDKHTLTIVEIDMLRRDYEAEHTLTQHASQDLRDAIADLAATKAAHAATAETATLESPQMEEAADSTFNAPTARIRAK